MCAPGGAGRGEAPVVTAHCLACALLRLQIAPVRTNIKVSKQILQLYTSVRQGYDTLTLFILN